MRKLESSNGLNVFWSYLMNLGWLRKEAGESPSVEQFLNGLGHWWEGNRSQHSLCFLEGDGPDEEQNGKFVHI